MNHTGGAVLRVSIRTYMCVWVLWHVCTYVRKYIHTCEWLILSCLNNERHYVSQNNHTLVYTHSVMYHSTTHPSSQAEVKSTLVHEVSHHWEATTPNCIVKACLTILIHLKLPVSKEGQQVLDTLKGSIIGSKVKSSHWTLCTWLVSWVECCIRLWVPLPSVTHLCFIKYIRTMCQQQFHNREVVFPCG